MSPQPHLTWTHENVSAPPPRPLSYSPSRDELDSVLKVPPSAAPVQCKPFLDAVSHGFELLYAWRLGIQIWFDGVLRYGNSFFGGAEEGVDIAPISRFGPHHFGIGTGYTFSTHPGIGTLFMPHRLYQLQAVPGLVETWWYPKPVFLVFPLPEEGCLWRIEPGEVLARGVLVQAGQTTIAPMNAIEQSSLRRRRAVYVQEEQRDKGLWRSDTGSFFSHQYKLDSTKNARPKSFGDY